MGKIIDTILYPKKEGFTGKHRPLALLLGSPYDHITTAVKYSNTIDLMAARGYSTLNKRPILFGHDFEGSIKNVHSFKHTHSTDQELTIWLESHGAPGWLFSGEDTASAEMDATINFARYVKRLELTSGLTVRNIILSSCYSANEYINRDETLYFNSPARMLSTLMPRCHVIGFTGHNASAKATSVYQQQENGEFKAVIAPLNHMAVAFQGGYVQELQDDQLYGGYTDTPDFVALACNIDRTILHPLASPILTIDRLRVDRKDTPKTPTCYGDWQLSVATTDYSPFTLPAAITHTPKPTSIAKTTGARRRLFFETPIATPTAESTAFDSIDKTTTSTFASSCTDEIAQPTVVNTF